MATGTRRPAAGDLRPADGSGRQVPFGLALVPVLALAGGIRLWHVLALRKLPLFDALIIDSRSYDLWGQRIASGDWLGDRAFYMDPLYPYALAILYRVFGHDLMVVRLVQAGLGVATCALVALLGRRIGGKAVGIAAGLVIALYQPLVFEELEIEKTGLGVFLTSAALVLATGRSLASRAGAGACLALAALTRGNLVLLAPFGVAYLLLAPTGGASGAPLAERWRRRLLGPPGKDALAFVLGLALVLTPVLWRNRVVSGEWILTTSQSGQNFYTGNNPTNRTGAYTVVPFVNPLPGHEEQDFRAMAERMSGRSMGAGEVSSFWFRKTMEHIEEHPASAAMVFLRKLVLFWSDIEIPDGWSVYFLRRFSPGLSFSFLTMGWLLPLAGVGAMGFFRARREVRLLVGYVVVYTLSVVAFFVFSRYRIYVIPAVAVLAALGGSWLLERARHRDWPRLLPMLAAAGVLCAVSFAGERWVGIDRSERIAYNFAYLADAHQDRGEFGAAESLLLEMLRLRPGRADSLISLGSLRLRAGDPAAAVRALEDASRADPRHPNVWYILGTAYEKAGDLERAKRCYFRQLEQSPEHQLANRRLQAVMAKPSRPGPAMEAR